MSKNPMSMVVCHSDDIDTEDAAMDLLNQADKRLGGEMPSGAILFAAIDYEHQLLLDSIMDKWPEVELIGCTTDGEISSLSGFAEDSAVLILFKAGDIQFSAGAGVIAEGDYSHACEAAYSEALKGITVNPGICISFPGNMSSNIDRIMSCLKEVSGCLPVFGGVPGDQWRFKTQYQFCGRTVYTDAVPILLIGGNLDFVYGIDSGWEPMGEFGVITKAEGNIIYTIDNKPAITFYKESLGNITSASGEFPLIVYDHDEQVRYQRAAGTQLDDDSGSMVFLGEIPEGAKVKIGSAERQVILNGTHLSVSGALEKLDNDDSIVGGLIFSCAARKALLGTQTERECRIVSDLIGKEIPFAGFYGYGELSPVRNNPADSMLHNQTFVTLFFQSR